MTRRCRSIAAAVRKTLAPAFARLGWEPVAGEDELRGQLRATLASALGTLGEDHEVQKRAAELYELWQREPARADRDLQPAFVSILAHAGDAARYDNSSNTLSPRVRRRRSSATFSRWPISRRSNCCARPCR